MSARSIAEFPQLKQFAPITANGDMVTICIPDAAHPQSVSTLGEVIFNAALAVRNVFDQVEEQRL